MSATNPKNSPLGKQSSYEDRYNPNLLFPIARFTKREEINVPLELPFSGADIWNSFELSWLNPNGKPMVAVATFIFPCQTPNIIESKSFKLYLNSFNNTKFETKAAVEKVLQQDLSHAAGLPILTNLLLVQDFDNNNIGTLNGISLDKLDIFCDTYVTNPEFLTIDDSDIVSESLYSDLLKSNCLVTGQPDWGSVKITYKGPKINHAGLLKYIISFRNHNEFHEQCVERIFMDISRMCKPAILTVEARYTRRGGLDINPFRSSSKIDLPSNTRLCRQ